MNFCNSPPGLEAIYQICSRLYPEQPNPLQVTAVVKFWLGGPDPLDYTSMYSNPGTSTSPPHWHYTSLGLTDLHGDGRVHTIQKEGRSGIGFELTFRLKKGAGETSPPTWPATLLQALARYIFHTGNTICSGDHIAWHCPLHDGTNSKIQHMLLTEDPQLPPTSTPLGTIYFLQIVGVFPEEIEASQYWNGPGIIELLKKIPNCGGDLLVTDMGRKDSIFLLSSSAQDKVDSGIVKEGSNLSGVTTNLYWTNLAATGNAHSDNSQVNATNKSAPEAKDASSLSQIDVVEIKESLKKGLTYQAKQVTDNTRCGQIDNAEPATRLPTLAPEFYDDNLRDLNRARVLDDVCIYLGLEAARLLPVVVRGRLKHGRHFTFKNMSTPSAITFVTNSVHGTLVDEEHPMAAVGWWLQIHIEEDGLDAFLSEVTKCLKDSDELPKTWRFEKRKLTIVVFDQ